MLSILKKLADNKRSGSLADRLRKKRFKLFLELIETMPRPLKIIDVGGTALFWERMGFTGQKDINITILNIRNDNMELPGFVTVTGDARRMKQFSDKAFDIAFSNSVIEHVGGFEEQKLMADEMKRIGKKIFLQTPNRYFPVEPHFLFPFFQFLPLWLKVKLLMKFNLGWYARVSDEKKAREICQSIRLMTKSELRKLFPGANIYEEKFYGIIKSFIVLT
jgi:ubiquinone/menaquinone biosynthesis C-methylase UbiE